MKCNDVILLTILFDGNPSGGKPNGIAIGIAMKAVDLLSAFIS